MVNPYLTIGIVYLMLFILRCNWYLTEKGSPTRSVTFGRSLWGSGVSVSVFDFGIVIRYFCRYFYVGSVFGIDILKYRAIGINISVYRPTIILGADRSCFAGFAKWRLAYWPGLGIRKLRAHACAGPGYVCMYIRLALNRVTNKQKCRQCPFETFSFRVDPYKRD